MFRQIAALALLSLPFTQVASVPHADHDHTPSTKRLPDAWFHDDTHFAHKLFKRQSNPTDGTTYATVGSPEWSKGFPPALPDSTKLPQQWVDALNAAVSAGKIPNIPPAQNIPNQNPKYPNNLDPTSKDVCSGTYKCRIPGDIWDAPTGTLGCGFDDG